MAKAKKANYSKEIEEIRRLRDLSNILKAGDMENALLSNAAKETETLNDNVLDKLLENADAQDQGKERGLEMITKLTTGGSASRTVSTSRVKVSKSSGKIKIKRTVHAVKKAKAARKRK